MSVKTTHPQYDKFSEKWERVRNVMAGDMRQYLRDVGKNESDPEYGAQRQKEYEEGAIVYNFTKRTVSGMVGSVMRRDPNMTVPDRIKFITDNADGSGVGLVQQATDTLTDLDSIGRAGLLVDAPETGAATMAEQNAGLLNPVIAYYTAENIVNWKTKRFGSVVRLSMVVLREEYELDGGDEFTHAVGEQYRVLDIFDGRYRQRLFKFGKDGKQDGDITEVFPKLGNLGPGIIPFTFIGSINNDSTPDEPPILPIADINIGHYRNSADSEENIFVTGSVMLTISPGEAMTPQVWKELNPNGVRFGARAGLNLGFGGTAGMLQANPSTAASQGMKDKEIQVVQIGAQLITPTTQITAESARIQRGADTSVMATIANNVSAAYTSALKWVNQALGGSPDEEIEFRLNTEFFLQPMTPQDRQAWVADVNAGLLPKRAYFEALRKADVTDWTDEEIEDEIDQQGPVAAVTEVVGEIPATGQAEPQPSPDTQQ